jgi:hypothetical protein
MFVRSRFALRGLALIALGLAFSGMTLGCQGETDAASDDGEGGSGGDGPDLNDSTCGTSDLTLPEQVELELVEGKQPKAEGGTVRPGTYDLIAWRLWRDPQPGNIPTDLRSTVLAVDEIGTLRLWTRSRTSSSMQSGSYSVSDNQFYFQYECPGKSNPSNPYSATDQELVLYTEDGQELVYRRQ